MTNFKEITQSVESLAKFIKRCMDGNCELCPVNMDRCVDWNNESGNALNCETVIKRWLEMEYDNSNWLLNNTK